MIKLASSSRAAIVVALFLTAACGGDSPSSSGSGGGGTGGSDGTGGAPGVGGSGGSPTTTTATGNSTATGDTTATGTATTTSSAVTSTSTGPGQCKSLGVPCTDCAFDKCQTVYCECFANADCQAVVFCLQTCGENEFDCFEDCFSKNPNGISPAFVLSDCAHDQCASVCPAKDLDDCELCLFTECDTAMNTCIANPECSAAVECIQDCAPSDTACAQKCLDDHPNGATDVNAVKTCLESKCDAKCDLPLP